MPATILSKDDASEDALLEIATACHVSREQIEDVYACTPIQNSSMAESSIRPGSSVFRFVLTLAPLVDIDCFCSALRQVAALNPVLRTRLVDCRVGLVQVVIDEEHVTERRSGDAAHYLDDDKARPLGLGAPLFLSAIIERKLVLTMHHAVMDHSSIPPLFRAVLSIYRGGAPPTGAAFKDFVGYCTGIDKSEATSFWASRFKGVPTIFPKVDSGYVPLATQRVTRRIALPRIGDGVLQAHVPSYIETAWALTARTYAGSDSIAYGMVLSGRTSALEGLERTLGPTIAIFPVQANLQNSMTVEALLRDRTTSRRQVQTHPVLQYGITRISAVSEAAKVASGFQTLLNIRPANDAQDMEEVSYDYMDEPHGAFGLSLACDLMNDGVLLEAASDPAVIYESQLNRIVHQFEHTLKALTEVPVQTKLDRLQLLSLSDHSEIMRWNSAVPETVEACIHDLFRAQARETPDALAVEASDGRATYRELDGMSDRLAHELRRRGVVTGSPVAFVFEKSLWTVVSVIGIMKAGGACVPIEKNDPHARKASVVSGAGAKTVLASAAELRSSMDLAPDVFAVSEELVSGLPDTPETPDAAAISPSELAYIIFTSGSTGTPKGVMLEHRSLATSLTEFARRFGWKPGFRVLQFAAHVWDISMGEMLGALLFGGCLCIPSEEARSSSLAGFIESSKVTWAWLTPTVLRTLSPDDVLSLKALLSIGEAIDARAAKTWGSSLRLINGWGPCEASILSAVAELKPDSLYPESIGGAIGGALWIANPRNTSELCPIGSTGEILIEGPGVARGYSNDKAKTAASFVAPPPWAPDRGTKPKHFFRTGDTAKYNPDGSICFIGRQDNQVKVRGQRFELGEVEGALSGCGEVRDVCAMTKISAGRTELVAVVCLSAPQLPRETVLQEPGGGCAEVAAKGLRAVRDFASARLPSFMVPGVWLAVEKMPRTPSAKLDRTAIRDWLKTRNLSSARASLDESSCATLTPPAGAEEELLQSVWSSVLDVPKERIGRESTFVKLGGDSILAMQVASRCHRAELRVATVSLLGRQSLAQIAESSRIAHPLPNGISITSPKNVSSGELFSGVGQPDLAATLSNLSARLAQLRPSGKPLEHDDLEYLIPATDTQAFMLATGEAGGRGYYIDFTLDFASPLDSARLRSAYEQVARHHPMLRTCFVQLGAVLYQVALRELQSESIVEMAEKPDLSLSFGRDATLARFHMASDGQLCHRVCLEIHHALYDAISLGLIFRDLDAAYVGNPLSDGPSSQSWASSAEVLEESVPRAFWREALRGSTMPYLVPPSPGSMLRGHPLDERMRIRVPMSNMRTSCGTPSSAIKAMWALLLSQALGADDVVFGETSANRYLPVKGVDRVRGPCVNLLPVRARLSPDMTLASLIAQVHEESARSLPHHHLGFRSIITDCTEWPSGTRFSTAMVYQNHGELGDSLEIGGTECTVSDGGGLGDSADIWAIASPGAEFLDVELRYSPQTLPSDAIHWIRQCLAKNLEALQPNLGRSLGQIEASVRNELGSYQVPPIPPCPLLNGTNGHPKKPSDGALKAVKEAWDELQLLARNPGDDSSMFDNGADAVTALLLAEYLQSRGFDISTRDIAHHPSQKMQACLVDAMRKKSE